MPPMTYDDRIQAAFGDRVGADVAEAVFTRAGRFSNLPNLVKGMAKEPGAPATESAALALVDDPAYAEDLGLEPVTGPGSFGPTEQLWALLTLAARADLTVLDRVADRWGTQGYAARLIASIRRAATKHATTAAVPATPAAADNAGTDVPQKVAEVRAWLAANAGVDPQVLAPHDGQKAAARVAAIRALGSLGTPQALAVLGQYAADKYPDKVLDELHKAWGNFDRREFAAAMFRQAGYALDLGLAATIEGIGGVPGLTSLDVVLTDGADLSPLAECTELCTLRVGAEGEPGLLGVEPLLGLPQLTELHLTRTTHNADLTPLAGLGVRRLRLDLGGADASFLLEMAHLERLLLSDQSARGETGDVVLALVRKGVRVTLYQHQRDAFAAVLAQVDAADDLFVVEVSGYLGLTADADAVDALARALRSNLVP